MSYHDVNFRYCRLSLSRIILNTSRYQYLDISDLHNGGKKFKQPHLTNIYITEVRDILNILWKRGGAISPLFHNIFYLLLDFHV